MKKANKTTIGAFVVGAAALLVIGMVAFGSGAFLKRSDKYVLYFERSAKGLSVGAPVIVKGVKIGNVSNVQLVYDPPAKEVVVEVTIDIELDRVEGMPDPVGYPDFRNIIRRGVRAKLDIQSFVTGQLMISLGLYPDKPAKLHNLSKKYPEIPTLPTPPDIFQVMDEIPVKEIADQMQQLVSGMNKLVNSPAIAEFDSTLRELTATARATRLLVEYLEAHPEAFLKGKQGFKLRGE